MGHDDALEMRHGIAELTQRRVLGSVDLSAGQSGAERSWSVGMHVRLSPYPEVALGAVDSSREGSREGRKPEVDGKGVEGAGRKVATGV